MSIRIALTHRTEYHYDRPVALAPHLVRLKPAPHCRTPILAYALDIRPRTHFINWQQDPFGNYLARLVFPERTRELSVEVRLTAAMTVINPFDFFLEEYAEHAPFAYPDELREELSPYLTVGKPGPLLAAWLKQVDLQPRPAVSFLVDINLALAKDIRYIVRMEPGVQRCEETLELRSGSCRDSAWLLVEVLRHLGLAARFVSGYLVQLTADQKSLDGPSGPAQDFTDLHAWAECYLPGAGWVGLDPTSGLFAGEGHIPLACSPSPQSAAPVSGAVEKCEVKFHHSNHVTRAHEDARVTKPYREEQWTEILSLGRSVDYALETAGLKLTQGGEPTFVSADDMDGEEWNTAALGEDKRKLAQTLVRRLKHRFAPDGLLHFGQGKWYPGEPLPRWAYACYWRKDGIALWKDDQLLADEQRGLNYGLREAARFTEALSKRLGFPGRPAIPAYEDGLYYLWREARLPVNVDIGNSRVEDPQERARLARLLDRGAIAQPAGYVLPLTWNVAGGFQTSAWPLRRERLYLVPGDSPLGYRLPLSALPWVEPAKLMPDQPPDLFAPREPLTQSPVARTAEPPIVPANAVRTALCLEPRDGLLYCFLPPLADLEAFAALIAAVEATAAALGLAVVFEGYEPPPDTRLHQFRITPDPGVIEVNIHPAHDFDQLAHNTQVIYEEARALRLSTEKFMLDGRHTGTGGGNHITLGGDTPQDSPFLNRPELLASLIVYWQHHPSLSYLFSGMFIGPTSQAPRVDEARDEVLYELGIALAQVPAGQCSEPWRVDRALRNLLVDMTGNTHRAEFCIDKLYSPDSARGRMGLVEMRAFEMPPHYRMSLAQSLLVRALLAWFAVKPYRAMPMSFGTALQDRYLLPHFVWQDFATVIADLNRAGHPLQLDWYAPFLEFRFPRIGEFCVEGTRVELRMALEPWHVLGEEQTRTGTARYVDSSVERVQVLAEGFNPERLALVCNQRRVNLRPACESGARLAGIRYKAWQPPSGLHPTLPAHTQLQFDVLDLASGVSLGGCTYHVSHPGGRHYEHFPVNAMEAEGRRAARFSTHGGNLGDGLPPAEMPDPDYPYTLDLRRSPAH